MSQQLRTTEQQRDAARAENARLVQDLAAALADAKTYAEQLSTADARVDQLLAVLTAKADPSGDVENPAVAPSLG